ncbi:tyrosine-type recombinase/integrase [Pseudoroseomonas cervicalis]
MPQTSVTNSPLALPAGKPNCSEGLPAAMTAKPPPAEDVPAGLKPIRKRLADGSFRTYYFDRRTGTALGTDRAVAIERLRDMREEALAPSAVEPGSFEALVSAFRASPEYLDKRATTRQQYAYEMTELLRDLHGSLLSDITPAVVYAIRDRTAAAGHRHKANSLIRMLRILFGFAKRRGLAATKPTDDVPLIAVEPRTAVWTPQQIEAFLTGARPSLQAGMALLLYTVQRLSDVMALTRENLHENPADGRLWIGLRQRKTSALVWTPCHQRLAAILRALPPEQHHLVPSPTGLPWPKRNFARSWDAHLQRRNKQLAEQGLPLIPALQRRDLRRTGMVQMALAGATPNQIAAVSGHSIDQTMKILDVYIPRRGDVAAGAITAWESSPGGETFSAFEKGGGNQFPVTGNRKTSSSVKT